MTATSSTAARKVDRQRHADRVPGQPWPSHAHSGTSASCDRPGGINIRMGPIVAGRVLIAILAFGGLQHCLADTSTVSFDFRGTVSSVVNVPTVHVGEVAHICLTYDAAGPDTNPENP